MARRTGHHDTNGRAHNTEPRLTHPAGRQRPHGGSWGSGLVDPFRCDQHFLSLWFHSLLLRHRRHTHTHAHIHTTDGDKRVKLTGRSKHLLPEHNCSRSTPPPATGSGSSPPELSCRRGSPPLEAFVALPSYIPLHCSPLSVRVSVRRGGDAVPSHWERGSPAWHCEAAGSAIHSGPWQMASDVTKADPLIRWGTGVEERWANGALPRWRVNL